MTETLKYYTMLRAFQYKRPHARMSKEDSGEKPRGIFKLPLPHKINDNTTISITNHTQGVGIASILAGDSIEDIVSGYVFAAGPAMAQEFLSSAAGGITSAVTKRVRNSLKSAGSRTQNLAKAAGAGGELVGGAFKAGIGPASPSSQYNLTTILQQNIGATSNPNPTKTFDGPTLRGDLTLSFELIPFNEKKAEEYHKLVRALKGYALPSVANSSKSASILNYPHLFQVNLFPWDKETYHTSRWGWGDNSIIRMKRCFLTSVNVEYNSQSRIHAFFNSKNNQPVITYITLTFSEVEYFMADDWWPQAQGRNNVGVADLVRSAKSIAGPIARQAGDQVSATTDKFLNSIKQFWE